jgi:uncharacterized Zn finger protein
MARTTKRRTSRTGRKSRPGWAKLTWDGLAAWAGERSLERGQSYQRGGRVRDLAVTADGELLAWVQGTHRYATTVELAPRGRGADRLHSQCTCPVGFNGCKHAVAVVLEYLEALRNKTPVPEADAGDRRWKLLDEEAEGGDWEDFEADEESEDDFEEDAEEPRRGRSRAARKSRAGDESLREFLQSQTAAQLVDLMVGLAGQYPEVQEALQERRALDTGRVGELVRKARREIEDLTAEPAWENRWTGEGDIPDYSGLQRRLEQLLEHGQADAVLELGRRLLKRGSNQVEESHDEGETASAIGECMAVVFRALPRSSLPNPQKILYAIDAFLADEYSILDQVEDDVFEGPWTPADWSAVADELARRLGPAPRSSGGDEFSRNYRRDRLSNWLIDALDRAERSPEALAFCEAEARLTGSYERLVRRLIAERRLDDAARWATEGIEKTEAQWPGIARGLREMLRELAEKHRDWPLAAAYRAEDFFKAPNVQTFKILLKAAAKAKVEAAVRAAALRFLETGKRPTEGAGAGTRKQKGASGDAWPLPALPHPEPASRGRPIGPAAQEPGPHFKVLLDLAIAEKRPDDVLTWYDRIQATRRRSPWGGYGFEDERVADAVAATHPERALAIYRKMADAQIDLTNPSAYQEAARHLRKVRKVLHAAGRDAEWEPLIAGIREMNARKRRLLEILDRLDNKRIVEG